MKWLDQLKFRCLKDAHTIHMEEIQERVTYEKRLEQEIFRLKYELKYEKEHKEAEIRMIYAQCMPPSRTPEQIKAYQDSITQLKEENETLTRRCISYMKAFDATMGVHEIMMEGKK